MTRGRDAKWALGRITQGLDGTCPSCRRVYAMAYEMVEAGAGKSVLRRHRREGQALFCEGSLAAFDSAMGQLRD
jgi:hypothetical protein